MQPIPHDLRRALQRSGLDEFFREHPRVHRVDYLRWIAASKRRGTRRRRIDEAVVRLARQWQEEVARFLRPDVRGSVAADPQHERRCA
ncbi:YdeI/OmpD-associated family protein [Opitutus terrae]|uniref:Uncharacterized protein n=1 Tax=Opitutus terrae (strain DSM 11246 / JCM 15787 / PB90-1) TaxID=452637 RepID=B1ZMY2_OPITP|nr:YdeI/OmpD-associated family protein [Opitutus terrae]ACB76434.1 hypothetical protein Oter_3154 [Opitutus terrae PB90-1]